MKRVFFDLVVIMKQIRQQIRFLLGLLCFPYHSQIAVLINSTETNCLTTFDAFHTPVRIISL